MYINWDVSPTRDTYWTYFDNIISGSNTQFETALNYIGRIDEDIATMKNEINNNNIQILHHQAHILNNSQMEDSVHAIAKIKEKISQLEEYIQTALYSRHKIMVKYGITKFYLFKKKYIIPIIAFFIFIILPFLILVIIYIGIYLFAGYWIGVLVMMFSRTKSVKETFGWPYYFFKQYISHIIEKYY